MIRLPPRSTRSYTLVPHTSLVRSPDIGWLFPIVGAHVAATALALFGRALLARKTSTHWSPVASVLYAAGALVAAFVLDLQTWRGAGMTGEVSGQGDRKSTRLNSSH